MVLVRVRLKFDSSPLDYAKKCWFVFDADRCSLVKDVAYLIARQFDLNQDIQLYMDDFLIPVNESAQVIRDNDLICVNAVESESKNTSLLTSDDVQSPKAKRRKGEKSEDQGKPKLSVSSVAQKPTVVNSTIKQAKSLLNRMKVDDSSSKSKPSARKLKAVTKKSATGATHTTFHSSSSSSSSESESSSSESSESDAVKSQQGNRANESKTIVDKPKRVDNKVSNSSKVKPSNGCHSASVGENGNIGRGKKRGRNRKRTLSSNIIVGGSHDVLTTKSTLYKSPKLGKEKASSRNNHLTFKDNSDSSGSEESSPVHDKAKKNTAAPGKGIEKAASQWDVQPEATVTTVKTSVASLGVSQPQQTVQLPSPVARDYSVLPDLQGPPRQGDKLAFKVLELSSSYTPVVSEYKEATVVSFDASSKVINIEYSQETMKKLMCQSKDSGKIGKFELQLDEEDGDQIEQQVDRHDQIALDSLIEPKLIL